MSKAKPKNNKDDVEDLSSAQQIKLLSYQLSEKEIELKEIKNQRILQKEEITNTQNENIKLNGYLHQSIQSDLQIKILIGKIELLETDKFHLHEELKTHSKQIKEEKDIIIKD